MRNFRKYVAWNNAIELSLMVYRATNTFPEHEKFGLSNQLRRASVSIASNIAEGSSRKSEIDFARFLEMALGSAFEIESQMMIAYQLKYIPEVDFKLLVDKLEVLEKQINSLITKIRKG